MVFLDKTLIKLCENFVRFLKKSSKTLIKSAF